MKSVGMAEEKLNVLYTIDDKEFPSMDYINVLEKMERLQNAQTIFGVNDVKYIIRYDEVVPRSKAIRYPSGKIKSLFYKHQRIFTEFLCFFELFYDEVAVFLCAVFHLHIVVIQICSRITPGFSKSFQNFVFTEFMCICSLLCIRTCPIPDLST